MTINEAMKSNPSLVRSFIDHLMYMVLMADDPEGTMKMMVDDNDSIHKLTEDIFNEHVQEMH